jgi:predicted dehydrogenase
MKNNTSVTRRGFLRTAGATLALPYIIPSRSWAAANTTAPSERITMGAIGFGGRGRYDLTFFLQQPDVQVVAVCDVQGSRRAQAKGLVDKQYGNKDCATYIDFRELLARTDIDAVLIATGDNWHAMGSIMAARAGKDIYSEKPMSVSMAEGRAVADTMKRYGAIYQCGTQRRSITRFRFAAELAQSGRLGTLHTLLAEKTNNRWVDSTFPAEPEPPRSELDWDMWLGPAAWRPFNRKYVQRGTWANHRDFSGAEFTEWGSHTVDLCQWANQADDTSPIFYEPVADTVHARYANGVDLIFSRHEWPLGVRYEGTEGWVEVDDDGNINTHPRTLLTSHKFGKGYPADNHIRNFLDCVKTRQQPTSPAETAHRSNTVCQIANICKYLNRTLHWDPVNEQFINDPEADRMLSRTMRAPWTL